MPRAALVGAFGLGLALVLVGALLLADVVLFGASTQADCAKRCFGNGKCCVVWDKNTCWRGEPQAGGACRKRSVVLPAVLLGVGGAMCLGGLVWFALSAPGTLQA